MQRFYKIIKSILLVIVVWFLIHSIYMTIDGLNDKHQNADVAVVLGNKINGDGTLSERLKARLDKSIELYNQQRVKTIIVSGGLGKEGFWEANKMQEYLIGNKIPKEKILVDNYGNDTEKTVENTLRMMDSLKFKSAISVSQYFHQTRTKKLFRNKGFKNIESASPDYFEMRDFYSILREFVAYYKEAI
ncbi:YdcF family protein [Epilithonimonas zeae]|uniref:YdcF family protein n=1 Tax=Epilithonimonas zeae TaxID=1416779 RepID=UPI00200CD0E2|nr:YdcF family protein [Epilithonimonas zeae]UQB68207.1 YdcF family protein [Epilithonimonas zeae]